MTPGDQEVRRKLTQTVVHSEPCLEPAFPQLSWTQLPISGTRRKRLSRSLLLGRIWACGAAVQILPENRKQSVAVEKRIIAGLSSVCGWVLAIGCFKLGAES